MAKKQSTVIDRKLLELPKLGASYQTLKKQIKNGHAPKEWDALYELISKRVKESLEKSPQNTFYYEEIETSYNVYSNYYNGSWTGRSAYFHAILLNDYLSKRLKSEGYEHACIRLILIPGNQSSTMDKWVSKWVADQKQREYESAYKDWQEKKIRYDNYQPDAITGYTPPVNPGRPPVAPNGDCVGFGLAKPVYIASTNNNKAPEKIPDRYVYIVQCSKVKSKDVKRSEKQIMIKQRSKTGSQHPGLLVFLAYILPILALAASLAVIMAIIGLVQFITNGSVEMDTMIILAGSLGFLPVFGGGLFIGHKIHDKLYREKYLL